MSLLSEIKSAVAAAGFTVEAGRFSASPPSLYAVLIPLPTRTTLSCDDAPTREQENARIAIYTRDDQITAHASSVVAALRAAGINITDRSYVGVDDDTGMYQYDVDAAKEYSI